MNFETVFDLAQSGYRNWWFPAFGLIFVALAIAQLVLRPLFEPVMRLLHFGLPAGGRARAPWLMLIFALLWVTVAFVVTYRDYARLRDALASGRYQTVEGPVRNFHPMPHSGHDDERFDVQGVRFAYSDFTVMAGFNNTASHGGPIAEGLYVRIAYVGNAIVRLEIRR